jgi:hypothetical protein
MADEQLRIPMPIIGVQVTLERISGRGWVLVERLRRQDAGWSPGERYRDLTTDEALDLCLTLLEVTARELG